MGYKNKDKQNEYQREWRRKRRSKWILENGPCVDCFSWNNLEVDHVDPSLKEAQVSTIWGWTKIRRDKELGKCVVRCSDCHLIKTTAYRSNSYRHGTYSMWINKKCRCELCIMAMRIYKMEYRKRTEIH